MNKRMPRTMLEDSNSVTRHSSVHSDQVKNQIESGILVCPETRETLSIGASGLISTKDGRRTYLLAKNGVPILIVDKKLVDEYATSSAQMNDEYSVEHLKKQESWLNRFRRRDYRTEASIFAQNSIFKSLQDNAVCISIGGGPSRADSRLLNLNIGPFPNVDVVGDAHRLPSADSSVDAIHCEAVFEHLHSPVIAANEIFRVLKPGSKAFICTPFLQVYHGYPHHYQNFTLTGHVNLFEKAGLKVTESGPCVGPTYTLRHIVSVYISNYMPFPFNKILKVLWSGISMCIAPIDIVLRNKPNAHIMASTTYLIAEKPHPDNYK